MNIIESAGLGKRYRRTWALRDCTLAVPDGHLVALVGPNGAGKTTLLHMAVGLVSPTAGAVRVLGGQPAGSPGALDGTAFVAQNAPLYPNLPVAAMLRVARNLNRQWDQPRAEARLAELGIPLDRKAGKLSGGQQAQLALTVALARRPRLLVLDEPLAALDPVAAERFHGRGAGRAWPATASRWCCPGPAERMTVSGPRSARWHPGRPSWPAGGPGRPRPPPRWPRPPGGH